MGAFGAIGWLVSRTVAWIAAVLEVGVAIARGRSGKAAWEDARARIRSDARLTDRFF
jgi:hypothetical protein